MLVDGGRFDWDASGKFPTLTEPYEASTAWCSAEESTVAAFVLRARREGLRDFGACMAPMTAFQILQGLETLHLRMPRHVATTREARRVPRARTRRWRACTTRTRPHPDHALARAALPAGLQRDPLLRAQGRARGGPQVHRGAALFSHLANIGDAKSLVIHPASTTHFRMDDAALAAGGHHRGTVRLSIGLEHPDDLVEDLSRALRASQK